ncbi:MAG TPA: HAD hydrolase-like protein [Saprospiraceae bacterium]|nr:HAD hydrolase-like protein [Saprospiraceae bacterium]HMP25406.1 HAD hydrolase-like protein [Saprospiraceae bacterium]
MSKIHLVVFDMAGTTVKDDHEVEKCFWLAAQQSNLPATPERIKAMQGYPKLEVVRILWSEAVGVEHPDYEQFVKETYATFRQILEKHYLENPVYPTEGTLELFHWLRKQGIKIALTTGFYRKVTNIILAKLGWDKGLDSNYFGSEHALIDLSLTPDETGRGRPHPDMILKAMEILHVTNPQQVINIGDTPADLQAGRAAGCLRALAVTNGTHDYAALNAYAHDGLLNNVLEVREVIRQLEAGYALNA